MKNTYGDDIKQEHSGFSEQYMEKYGKNSFTDSNKAEDELVINYVVNNDKRSYEALCYRYGGIVTNLATKYYKFCKNKHLLTIYDFINEGFIGLEMGIKNYYKTKFEKKEVSLLSQKIFFSVKVQVWRFLNSGNYGTENNTIIRQMENIRRAKSELFKILSKEPTVKEIAAYIQITKQNKTITKEAIICLSKKISGKKLTNIMNLMDLEKGVTFRENKKFDMKSKDSVTKADGSSFMAVLENENFYKESKKDTNLCDLGRSELEEEEPDMKSNEEQAINSLIKEDDDSINTSINIAEQIVIHIILNEIEKKDKKKDNKLSEKNLKELANYPSLNKETKCLMRRYILCEDEEKLKEEFGDNIYKQANSREIKRLGSRYKNSIKEFLKDNDIDTRNFVPQEYLINLLEAYQEYKKKEEGVYED